MQFKLLTIKHNKPKYLNLMIFQTFTFQANSVVKSRSYLATEHI